ncbi:hypothetical protein N7461_002859 [Penicillium sp. DV-2018c]|nr:hypothetical protein N7461_002859 [Penicillium sp. DV-2018c]
MTNTAEEFKRIRREFDLSSGKWWDKIPFWREKGRSPPEHLQYLWEDIRLVAGRKKTHPQLSVRTESLLITLLARKIREQGLEGDGSLSLPHWGFQSEFDKRGPDDDQDSPKTLIDFVLWYGHHCELETNMLGMKSDTPDLESWKLLENMAFIHQTRKCANREAAIHGVMTDGSNWTFMHISNSSRYTTKTLSWDKDKHRIIGRIEYIVDKAFHRRKEILSRYRPFCRVCGHSPDKKRAQTKSVERQPVPSSGLLQNSHCGPSIEGNPVASGGLDHNNPMYISSDEALRSQASLKSLGSCFRAGDETD